MQGEGERPRLSVIRKSVSVLGGERRVCVLWPLHEILIHTNCVCSSAQRGCSFRALMAGNPPRVLLKGEPEGLKVRAGKPMCCRDRLS